MIVAVIVAAVLGGAWRRWWGEPAARWWPWKLANGDGRFYRGFQAIVGFAALLGAGLLGGLAWWDAALRSGLALGFLTTCAQSIPHIWMAWFEVDRRVRLPRLGAWFDGWSTYAEATAGAVVWALALAIRF